MKLNLWRLSAIFKYGGHILNLMCKPHVCYRVCRILRNFFTFVCFLFISSCLGDVSVDNQSMYKSAFKIYRTSYNMSFTALKGSFTLFLPRIKISKQFYNLPLFSNMAAIFKINYNNKQQQQLYSDCFVIIW